MNPLVFLFTQLIAMAQYFDPDAYKIVLFDQRGCGKSTPFAEIRENTTQDLVEDMERLRKELNINKWQLCGGSWGSTLALAYSVNFFLFVDCPSFVCYYFFLL
jgi:proline iminopeptidase